MKCKCCCTPSPALLVRQRKSFVKANAEFTMQNLQKASQSPRMNTVGTWSLVHHSISFKVQQAAGCPSQKTNRRGFSQLPQLSEEYVLFRNNRQNNTRLIKALISYTQKNSMHNLKRKQKQGKTVKDRGTVLLKHR